MNTTQKETQKESSFINCRQYIYDWEQLHFPYLKPSTRATYLSIIENHILPYYGSMDLQDITFDVNQEFIYYLCREGRTDGAGGAIHQNGKRYYVCLACNFKNGRTKKLALLS